VPGKEPRERKLSACVPLADVAKQRLSTIRFVPGPGVVCNRTFERSELRNHSHLGLELLDNVVSRFPLRLREVKRGLRWTESPGFSRGAAYASLREMIVAQDRRFDAGVK
jgi:hypothetical protein